MSSNVFVGLVVAGIALNLALIALVVTPLLKAMKVPGIVQVCFAAMCVSLSAYLANVSALFFRDALPHLEANYGFLINATRIVSLVSATAFLFYAWRAGHRLYRRAWAAIFTNDLDA